MTRLNYYWRILATGFCFSVFGIGGIIGSSLITLVLAFFKQQQRQRIAKNCIHYMMWIFVRLMSMVGVIRVKVIHAERLQRRGLLILANHPSLIDVVILMSLVKNPDCIVKASLWKNPFTGGPVRVTGFLSNASGPKLVESACASIDSGNNLIIFPEGTRTTEGMELSFQRGASNIAVHGKLRITPVTIKVSQPMLTKSSKWYRPPSRVPHFEIHVLEDLDLAPVMAQSNESTQQVRKVTAHLEQFFSTELARCDLNH